MPGNHGLSETQPVLFLARSYRDYDPMSSLPILITGTTFLVLVSSVRRSNSYLCSSSSCGTICTPNSHLGNRLLYRLPKIAMVKRNLTLKLFSASSHAQNVHPAKALRNLIKLDLPSAFINRNVQHQILPSCVNLAVPYHS